MPSVTEADLKKQIKSGDFSNLYFFYGDEKYLVRHYTDLFIKKIVKPDFADFNFHTYDGKDLNFTALYEATEALPMMSEYTCILIKDLPIDALNNDLVDDFTKLISDIPETTIIIISNITIATNIKSSKGKNMLSVMTQYGTVVQFAHASIFQLNKLIVKGAEQRGCQIKESDASYLISLVGDDMLNILNELEKICSFKKEGMISRSDIDSVAVKNIQAKAFDLTKALIANRCDEAMDILDSLFYMKEEPISILGAIITNYIDMYRVKVYISSGKVATDVGKNYNYRNKEFRLKNAARSASKYSMFQLRKFLEVLNEADTMLKSTAIDARLILEQTITKLLLVSNGEKV